MKRFKDKMVIATGSGIGIGKATAEGCPEEGANVVLVGCTLERLEVLCLIKQGRMNNA